MTFCTPLKLSCNSKAACSATISDWRSSCLIAGNNSGGPSASCRAISRAFASPLPLAATRLDGAGVGEHADVDLGECELRVLLHDDDVRSQHDLEAAAAGDTVDRRDEGLVEIARMIQATEAARTPVLV